MDNISDLKIIGVDENRPSKMQKQPYIDLVFKLSHQAPKVWCDNFNTIFKKYKYAVKIDEKEGAHIITWVRAMEEIPDHLKLLQTRIKECNEQYIQNAKDVAAAEKERTVNSSGEHGEQGKLNQIIAGLNFD